MSQDQAESPNTQEQEVFVIETLVGNDWENLFKEDDKKMTFPSEAAAQAELDEFIKETQEEYEAGNLDDPYDPEDYRIEKVRNPSAYLRFANRP